MNSFLLNRQLGSISPHALANAQNNRLLRSLQASPNVTFSLLKASDPGEGQGALAAAKNNAHEAGVSSIAIDPFEGRYLLSTGADSSVAIWDLELAPPSEDNRILHTPLGHSIRTSTAHNLGITHGCFYPFDSLAFLTSGYDHSLKIFSSETLQASATFDLGSNVYSHSVSTVATHLLVACASQHPAVRLVDLGSGSSTHSLAGHSGTVLAVAWHPKNENLLASGATDGTLRLWDIRRSASSLGVLDMEDSVGITGYDGKGTGARGRERGRAHNGAVNGIAWTSDGQHIVSVGHDERMRVWDVTSGANTLVNFGPGLKNSQTTAVFPLLAPAHLSSLGNEVVYFPNPSEILGFDLHSGTMLNRMRISGPQGSITDTGTRNLKPRTTSLTWRAHDVEMYSGHADGAIRCWRPRTGDDIALEREDQGEEVNVEKDGDKKRKREELESIVRDLTGRGKTTYS